MLQVVDEVRRNGMGVRGMWHRGFSYFPKTSAILRIARIVKQILCGFTCEGRKMYSQTRHEQRQFATIAQRVHILVVLLETPHASHPLGVFRWVGQMGALTSTRPSNQHCDRSRCTTECRRSTGTAYVAVRDDDDDRATTGLGPRQAYN